MTHDAIAVTGLSKRFSIASNRRAESFREALMDMFAAPFGRRAPPAERSDQFWALRDLSFTVKRGEVVGVIGRNGAGKSTLLKILSRITAPTEGKAVIRGRVASLLEVGTGFHGELSGRENIFLNGTILGMTRREIQQKLDEIVAFAEIEQFLDVPVKRYSSGMAVRLAFAVAAHLDNDILIVDEVLAVGDAAFQLKCMDRMRREVERGKTLLVVSHDQQSIERLCSRVIYLKGGSMVFDGSTGRAFELYEKALEEDPDRRPPGRRDLERRPGEARFVRWGIDGPSVAPHTVASGERVRLDFVLDSDRDVPDAIIGLGIWSGRKELAISASSMDSYGKPLAISRGMHEVAFEVALPLRAGQYQLDVSLTSAAGGRIDRWAADPMLVIVSRADADTTLHPEWQGLIDATVAVTVRPQPRL
jgi:lipopolysaccharide transport system ATP-binding protein